MRNGINYETGQTYDELVGDLLGDPAQFDADGGAHALLQYYFRGAPISDLRPLLSHAHPLVQKAAVFIASELGNEAAELLPDIVPLLGRPNRWAQYLATEIVALCSQGAAVANYSHVVLQLESTDDAIRMLAMSLLSSATLEQLRAARHHVTVSTNSASHQNGLALLLLGPEAMEDTALAMLNNDIPLLRSYGTVAVLRNMDTWPALLRRVRAHGEPQLRKLIERLVSENNQGKV